MAGGSAVSSASNSSYQEGVNYTKPFITVTFLFFMWGFLTCMNDILIPSLREIFELNVTQGMLVQFAFFIAYFFGALAYFIISSASGDPINKMGYKNGLILGLLISATGCALFIPAAQYKVYGFFLGALFILGLGFTLLQIAANPYVTLLGKPKTASSRLNLAQGFNSFGTTIAPIVGGHLVYSLFAETINEKVVITVDSVKMPYLIFALLFVLLAGLVKITSLPSFNNDEKIEKGAKALKFPQLRFGMIAIFMYVGGEVTIGSILINFFKLDNIMGFEEVVGTTYLAFYWGGAMIGRFMGAISLSELPSSKKIIYMILAASLSFGLIFGASYWNSDISFTTVLPYILFMAINFIVFLMGKSLPGRTLALFAGMVILLLFVTMFTDGQVAFWSVISIGLFNSIMWSNIFTLAIKGLGKYTSQGSSLLVMMILGGALIPLIQGLVADMNATPDNKDAGIQMSFIVPVFCYVYLLMYGLFLHRPKSIEEVESKA